MSVPPRAYRLKNGVSWKAPIAALLLFSFPLWAKEGDRTSSTRGVVVTVSGPASEVGARILGQGGNAVDAAVATAFALAVTFPEAGNIGGGGYMIFHPGDEREPVAYDFRETAPAASTKTMFVSPDSRSAHRRVGVPGTVAGLALAHAEHGTLPWQDLLAPAIELARVGFEVDQATAKSMNEVLGSERARGQKEFHRVFARPGGGEWQAGDRLVQPDLKATLIHIAEHGPRGFYEGIVAEQIVKEMELGGGLITNKDLASYRPIRRKPLHGTYRGHDVYGMPPSSSGGTALLEMLNILEHFDLAKHDRWSPITTHLMVEAARRAYRDRACYLGDPAFTVIPTFLLDKEYARKLAAGIELTRATPSTNLAGEIQLSQEPEETTHFSIADKNGAAVSLTYTLESSYGGCVVVRGAGFILNDEMNDFAWLPGVTNATGRIGTPPNQIVPGKRMLSSMCPIILAKNGKPLLVTGSPGGRTIINTVLCVVVNFVDFEMSPRDAVDAPRFHHPWLPDKIRLEEKIELDHPALMSGLERMGHLIEMAPKQGDAHTLWVHPQTGEMVGIPDRRISGKAAYP